MGMTHACPGLSQSRLDIPLEGEIRQGSLKSSMFPPMIEQSLFRPTPPKPKEGYATEIWIYRNEAGVHARKAASSD